ncbi:MAG: 6-bladed beta-propeller [Planctomycetota bacterium]|jgi:hypothetical protein
MNVVTASRWGLVFVALLCSALACAPVTQAAPTSGGVDRSDINGDGVVDILDLDLFSTNYLELSVTEVDWCAFYTATVSGQDFNGASTKYYAKQFKMLLAFIFIEFDCEGGEPPPPPPPADVEPKYLVRVAQASDGSGRYFFTDARTHSVFTYDAQMTVQSELTGLDSPLGIAMDSRGYLLVGNDGRDNVEVFDPDNNLLLAVFGNGLVKMPTAITVAPDGLIYVTDSQSHKVWVFDADYALLRSIGSGGQGPSELNFPTDTEVVVYGAGSDEYQEIFIGDQGNNRVQIYDAEGNHLRTIKSGCGSFSCRPPELKRVQALSLDGQGRLHVLDNFKAVVNILDPQTGASIAAYGEYGEGAGFLRVPMDLLINDLDEAVITAGDGARIEVLGTP